MNPRRPPASPHLAAEYIHAELHDVDPEKARLFALEAKESLQHYKQVKVLWQVDRRNRADLPRLLKATRRYSKHLQDIPGVWATPFPADYREFLRPPGEPESLARIEAVRQLCDALDATHRAVDILEPLLTKAERQMQAERPAGRKADAHGLLTHIAHKYLEMLGKRPTQTRGGPFWRIAEIVLEHTSGSWPADVSRQVRAAIKAM